MLPAGILEVPLQVEEKGAGFLLFYQSCLFLHSYYCNVIFNCKDCRVRSGLKMQSPKNSLVLKVSSNKQINFFVKIVSLKGNGLT